VGVSLQENPTLAIRLGPMAESRLYKIAHPAIFCDLSFVCPIQTGLTDHAINESDQRVISLTPPLFFLRAQNCWGSVRNYSTACRIDLTSVWCRHANRRRNMSGKQKTVCSLQTPPATFNWLLISSRSPRPWSSGNIMAGWKMRR
jgi:hypothetical protein